MLVKFTVESWWPSTSWFERLKKWIVGPLGTHPVLAVDKIFCLEALRFFSLVQAWHSPVVPPQTWSAVHFSFSGPRHPMSIFLWSLCVCLLCVCMCARSELSPARAPSLELLFDGKSHASESPDSCCASCSALASTWVWLASLRICFDCRYITRHSVLGPPFHFTRFWLCTR